MASKYWDASLSTMWARKNFHRLDDFFAAARRLGFAKIELNHQIDSNMLAGLDLSHIHFSSVHEPCPADISTETLKERDWLVSAQDEDNRRQGVEAVKRSIYLASKLEAGVIVVHAGNVLADLSLEKKMRTLFEAGRKQSSEYLALKDELHKTRATRSGPRLDAVQKSLVELLEIASRHKLRLGLENRYHYADIPSPDEMELFLNLAGPDRLGFIYDVGHAQALDQLGFFPHAEWLERFSTRIIGAHLHDVVGVADHYAPGLGEVDFEQVATFLPKEAFRTLEVHPKNTPEQIEKGMKFLWDHDCIGYL